MNASIIDHTDVRSLGASFRSRSSPPAFPIVDAVSDKVLSGTVHP